MQSSPCDVMKGYHRHTGTLLAWGVNTPAAERRDALLWSVGTFVVYALMTWCASTAWNAHSLMANSILHGRWDLDPPYGSTELVTTADGRKLVAYGIGPSLLMLPWIALLGPGAPQIGRAHV